MNKKIGSTFKITAIALSCVFLIAGCGSAKSASVSAGQSVKTPEASTESSSSPSQSPTAAPKKVVKIRFWNGHPSGALQKQMHAEVDEFNQSHPYIHVSSVDKYSKIQNVNAAFAAKKAPNVAMPHITDAPTFAQAGYLVNLTPYIHSATHGLSESNMKNDYYPAVLDSIAIDKNKQYLMPYEESVRMVIYYNEDLLKKAGIVSPPKTWDDIQADARKITALGSDYHGIAWTPSMEQLFAMTEDFGGKIFADADHTRFELNNAGANQALSMLRSMVVDKSLLLTKDYSYQVSFGAGKSGILIDASSGYTYDVKSAGGKFKVGAISAPSGKSGKSSNYVYGDALAMFNTGTPDQKRAAWTFIKWLSSPTVNTEWNEHTNYVPIGPAAAQQMKSFYAGHPDYAASFSDPANWITSPPTNGTAYAAAMNAMKSDFQKALLGQESVSKALDNMNTIGNDYMSGKKKG